MALLTRLQLPSSGSVKLNTSIRRRDAGPRANLSRDSHVQPNVKLGYVRLVLLALTAAGCAAAPRSSMLLERRSGALATSGPDAIALPVLERYRYGVVVGSVVTASGERGCTGDVWLQPRGAPVMDVRAIAPARLHNMFRFPQLLPGRYVLGVRCMGFQPVRRGVDVRVGQVVRAVVTMRPQPLHTLH